MPFDSFDPMSEPIMIVDTQRLETRKRKIKQNKNNKNVNEMENIQTTENKRASIKKPNDAVKLVESNDSGMPFDSFDPMSEPITTQDALPQKKRRQKTNRFVNEMVSGKKPIATVQFENNNDAIPIVPEMPDAVRIRNLKNNIITYSHTVDSEEANKKNELNDVTF